MKWPFLKFYTRDWQSDFELRMCSLEARGFWIECLCIMHNAKRRGYMETPSGQPLTNDQTARLIGTFKGDVEKCLAELLEHGVYSLDENGVIHCRRMVKEAEKAEKCSIAGKKGGGSPLLTKDSIKKKPETRNHISLKDTFKGQDSQIKVDQFEEAWIAYGRYGVKKKSKSYWSIIPQKDRESIIKAIPIYLQCVAAGRSISQFEGWINPSNRKWDMNWNTALSSLITSGDKQEVALQTAKDTRSKASKKKEQEYKSLQDKMRECKSNEEMLDVICNSSADFMHHIELWAMDELNYVRP